MNEKEVKEQLQAEESRVAKWMKCKCKSGYREEKESS